MKKGRKGTANHSAKLKEADVQKIKEMTGIVPQEALAQAHNVRQQTIHAVQTGKSWKHLWAADDQARLAKAREDGTFLPCRGAKQHPRAKLNEAVVAAIRKLDRVYPQRTIAKMYNVSLAQISRILRGEQWRCASNSEEEAVPCKLPVASFRGGLVEQWLN